MRDRIEISEQLRQTAWWRTAWPAGWANAGRAEQLIVVSHGMAGRALRMLYLAMPRAAIGDLREEHGTFFRLSEGEVARIAL